MKKAENISKKAILLSPSGRCGTNWIAQIIEAHSKTQVKTEPLRQQLPYENPINPLGIEAYLPTIEVKKVFEKQNFALQFWNNFASWMNTEEKISIIKETNTYFKLKWLKSYMGPETKWIILNRDTRGIVASFKRRNLFERWEYNKVFNKIEKTIQKNSKLQREYFKSLKSINRTNWLDQLVFLHLLNFNEISKNFYKEPLLLIQYEKTVNSPKKELKKILDYLGLNLDKQTERFIQNTLTPDQNQVETDMNIRKLKTTGDWKNILTEQEKKRVVKLVSSIVEEMPYIKKFCINKKCHLFYLKNQNTKNQRTKNGIVKVIDYRNTELMLPDFQNPQKEIVKEIEQNLTPGTKQNNKIKICSTLTTNKQFTVFLNWLAELGIKNVFQKHFVFQNTSIHENTGGRIFQKNQKFYILKGFEEHPVNWVTYFGANMFCKWTGYRLLTAEEYNNISKQPDYLPKTFSNVNHLIGDTSKVKQFPNNELGFYDENSNVYSWTTSYYGTPNKSVQKTVKGGAWNKPSSPLTVNYAKAMFFTARSLGFRVASDYQTTKNRISEKEYQKYVKKFFKVLDNHNKNPFSSNIKIDNFFKNKT